MTNPFAAARFSAGALPWIDREADPIARWFERVAKPGARFQVIGPHGSGKTTLFAALERHARRAGASVLSVRGSRLDAAAFRALVRGPRLVLLDEAEELSPPARFAAAHLARRSGLVVGTHCDLGLPTLADLEVDVPLAHAVVERLLAGHDSNRVSPWWSRSAEENDLRLGWLLGVHRGNLREVLFALYDEFETVQRSRMQRPPEYAAL